MKRILFKLFSLSMAAILLLDGCRKEDPPYLNLDGDSELTANCAGETIFIRFSTNVVWNASSSDEWISVSPAEGIAGDYQSLSVKVMPNQTYDGREGQVTISAGEIKRIVSVKQEQNNGFSLSEKSFEIGRDGGTLKIPVRHNAEFACTVDDEAKSWISVNSTKAMAESMIVLEIAANDNTDSRTGHVTISMEGQESERIEIKQLQKDELIVAQKEFEIGSAGGTVTVQVSANVAYSCEVLGSASSWISVVSVGSKGMESTSLVLNVDGNAGYDGRVGQVKVVGAGKESVVTITQSQMDELLVTATEFEIGSAGGSIKVPVSTNVDYECVVLDSATGWIEVETLKTKGLDDYFLVLKVAENSGYDGRVGQVKVVGAGKESIVTVTQSQLDELLVTTTEFEIGSDGGDIKIPVSTNVEYECVVLDSATGWIEVETLKTKGLDDCFLVVKVAENSGYDGRVGQVKVVGAGKESVVTITQSQHDEVIVTATEFEIGSDGGTIKVPVSANIEYRCETLESAAGWITVEAVQTKGLDDYFLVLKVAENSGYDGRVGQVKVVGAGKESVVTITQSQYDEVIVTATEFEIGSDGGTIKVPVSANVEYECQPLVSGSGWIEVESLKTKGLDESFIVLKVAKNTSYDGRVGQVKVVGAGKESIVTVTQSQRDEVIVTTTEFEIGSAGGTINVPVRANVEYECQVLESAAGWISVEAVQTKSLEDYYLVLTVDAIEGSSGRTGQVKVTGAGKESVVTITQSQLDELIVTTTEFEIGSDGGTINVPVTTNVEYECQVLESASGWITVKAVQTKSLDDYYLVLKVAENKNYDGRVGQVKVIGAGKESIVTVTQKQKDAILIGDASSYDIPYTGGEVDVEVRANIDVTASVSASWLHVVKSSSTKGLTSEQYVVTVDKNSGQQARTGTITFTSGSLSQK